jgi:hypothetical protein
MKSFLSGLIGGAVMLAVVLLFCVFSLKLYHYNIGIINPQQIDTTYTSANKLLMLKELHGEGTVLTPQEYTNNIVSYYNTAITLLVFLFILFSFVSYFHLRFLSNEQIHRQLENKIKDSREIEEILLDAFTGKADSRYETIENIEVLRDAIDQLGRRLDSLESEEGNIKNTKIHK